MRRRFLTIGMALALGCMAGAALAQDDDNDQQRPPPTGPQPGDTMDFCGRVVELVQSGCVGIVTLHATYELTSVSPKPPIGALIRGTGVIGNDPNMCQQGWHFRSATWSQTALCTDQP